MPPPTTPYRMYGGERPDSQPAPPKAKLPVVMHTCCLQCGAEYEENHKSWCPVLDSNVRAIQLNLKYLISTYGLDPAYATLDETGVLTFYGTSKER